MTFAWDGAPKLEDTSGPPFGAGSLEYEAGFTFQLDQDGIDSLMPLFAGATFDPDLDERIANERCPSCGRKLFGELPAGHAWSLDLSTQAYKCSDPPYPGGPVTFTTNSSARLERRAAGVLVPWEGRR